MKRIFKSRIKGLFYIFLQNRFTPYILDTEELKLIKESNYLHNNYREDYFDPKKYGSQRLIDGENWESKSNKIQTEKGKFINSSLISKNPKIVLEIGPGAGYYTKLIFDYVTVEKMEVIDINHNFIQYLNDSVSKNKYSNKSFHGIQGDIMSMPNLNKCYDMIILNSTLHHIPDRQHLFEKLNTMLNPNGSIIVYEPTHYIIRIIQLLIKIPLFISKNFVNDGCNYSTHHFCTLAEFKLLTKNINGLKIDYCTFTIPNKIKRIIKIPILRLFKHYFSTEMGVIFIKL